MPPGPGHPGLPCRPWSRLLAPRLVLLVGIEGRGPPRLHARRPPCHTGPASPTKPTGTCHGQEEGLRFLHIQRPRRTPLGARLPARRHRTHDHAPLPSRACSRRFVLFMVALLERRHRLLTAHVDALRGPSVPCTSNGGSVSMPSSYSPITCWANGAFGNGDSGSTRSGIKGISMRTSTTTFTSIPSNMGVAGRRLAAFELPSIRALGVVPTGMGGPGGRP